MRILVRNDDVAHEALGGFLNMCRSSIRRLLYDVLRILVTTLVRDILNLGLVAS